MKLTVPAGAKSGILVICGSFWNNYGIVFTDPTGSGIVSATKLHDAYSNDISNIHFVIYDVALKSGDINVTMSSNVPNATGGGASIVLLY